MKIYISISLFGILLSFCFMANAQKTFSLIIENKSYLDSKNLHIYINNGKDEIEIERPFINNQLRISNLFYSKYATIIVVNSSKHFYKNMFWISEKPATIALTSKDSTQNPLKDVRLNNAFTLTGMGGEKLENFIAKEQKEFDESYQKWNKLRTDSLQNIFNEKVQKLINKRITFIKRNPRLYYSFWDFQGLSTYNYANPDSLINVYNATFLDDIKNSFEGKEIFKMLIGRTLRKGSNAPMFITEDTLKQVISLNNYRGKYLILDFWASWCGPCIEEMPVIRRIRANYPKDKLEIISITKDENHGAFSNAVQKQKMNWIHIFNDKNLIKSYGAWNFVPKIFLIDPDGKIVYTRDDEKEYNLVLLTKLLSEALSK